MFTWIKLQAKKVLASWNRPYGAVTAYWGHLGHAGIGAMIFGFSNTFFGPIAAILILSAISIGHELYDHDLTRKSKWNGIADVTAFWLGAVWYINPILTGLIYLTYIVAENRDNGIEA